MKQFYLILISVFVFHNLNSQTFFPGNDNESFNGLLGFGSLEIDFLNSSFSETYFYFEPGSDEYGAPLPFGNNLVVIYIDSDETRNYVDTFLFTDAGDDHRRAISGTDGGCCNQAPIQFPPGFEADYAIAFNPSYAGLWRLNENMPHDSLEDLEILFDGTFYSFALDNINIGDPSTFKFLATYISNSGFRSDEAIGEIDTFKAPGVNPGWDYVEFTNYWTIEELIGGFGSTTSLATVWSFDGSWTNGNPPLDTDEIRINHDMIVDVDATVGEFIINSSNTVTINPSRSLTISGNAFNGGDLTNNGTLIMNSSSTQFSSLRIGENFSGSGTTTYNRFTAEVGPTGTNDLIASPFTGQQVNNFAADNSGDLAVSGSTAAFAPFNPNTGNYENYDTSNTSTIDPGQGFRAGSQASGGETLAFGGTPTVGNVAVTLIDNVSFWNLTGNPYTSYIRLGDFLSENSAVTNIRDTFYGVYGYDADASGGGGGSIWTIWDLNVSQDLLIAPGQGFFVAAPSGGGSGIDFTPSMQRIGTSDDFIAGRNANSTNYANAIINLNTASTAYVTNIYFRDTNTRGLDPGFDTGAFDQNANGIYTHLVEDNAGVALANQSLPYNDLTDIVVPLVVNIDPAEQITFSLDNSSDLPNSVDVYLDDTVSSTSTLLNSGDYTITPSVTLNGAGRFYLRFAENALTIEQSTFNTISISAQNKEIIISGEINSPTKANLYDLQGRVVLTNSLNVQLTRQTIDASRLSSGIYIIELSDGETSRTKKLILN